MKPKTTVLAVLFLALSVLLLHAQKPPATSSQQPAQQPGVAPPPGSSAQTKIDPAKEADIRKLLEITGAKALALQSMDAMLKSIRPLLASSLPPGEYREKVIDLFFEKFRSRVDAQQLLELIVPVYDKHLSHEEIKALIQFYETPLGKKTLSALPAIALESREVGEKWGQALGSDCMTEVLTEHPELKSALEAAGKNAP
jgi:uncharacterized protein